MMNVSRRLSTVLALASLCVIAGAQEGDTATAEEGVEQLDDSDQPEGLSAEEEEVDEWTELDQELAGLQYIDVGYKPMAELWGYGRTNIFYQDQPNSLGVNLDNLRFNLTGQVKGYEYRLTTELAAGNLEFLDGWVSTRMGESLAFTLGLFKIPLLRSGLIEASDLLFIARTRNGIFYAQRDLGAMVNGDHGRFHWRLAGQNGANGPAERQLTTGHVEVNVIGEPQLPYEGAYNAGSTTRLTMGVGFSNDDSASDGLAVALEANFVNRRFSFQAEWMDYGDDYTLADAEQRGGTQPWSLTTSYMLVPLKYEVALRYDDFDDVSSPVSFSRRTLTAGLNRYIEGHGIKWQLNVASAHKGGSADGPHDLVAALGLTVSF